LIKAVHDALARIQDARHDRTEEQIAAPTAIEVWCVSEFLGTILDRVQITRRKDTG
jgi:hypothetical protein